MLVSQALKNLGGPFLKIIVSSLYSQLLELSLIFCVPATVNQDLQALPIAHHI